jgi:hypothetical protein
VSVVHLIDGIAVITPVSRQPTQHLVTRP